MKNIIQILMILSVVGCVHRFRSTDPIAVNPSDNLFYAAIDLKDLPMTLENIQFRAPDNSSVINAARIPVTDGKRAVVIVFFTAAPDKPYYLSAIESGDTGFMASGALNHYVMTPQNSVIKIKSGTNNQIRYFGSFKFKEHEQGFFEMGKFSLAECTDCISEAEVLKRMVSHKIDLLDSNPRFRERLEKRLAALEVK